MTTAIVAIPSRRTPSKEADAAIGERAHMLIWRTGRTQTDVADALGVDSTGLGKKLKGKNRWAIQEVINLAAELGTTVAYLVGESDDSGVPDSNLPPTDYKAAGSGAAVIDLMTRVEVAS